MDIKIYQKNKLYIVFHMHKSKPLEFLNNQMTELDNINNMNNLNDLNNQQHQNDLNNQQINDNINNQRNNDNANNQPILNDVNNQNDKQIKYKHIHDILHKLYFIDKNFDGIDQLLRKAKVIDNQSIFCFWKTCERGEFFLCRIGFQALLPCLFKYKLS